MAKSLKLRAFPEEITSEGIKIYGAKNRKPEFIDDKFLETLGNILGKKQ